MDDYAKLQCVLRVKRQQLESIGDTQGAIEVGEEIIANQRQHKLDLAMQKHRRRAQKKGTSRGN